MPVRFLLPELGQGDIPTAPPEAAVGMPADLLRRRPDSRRAERLVASQSARVGVATADLYPHFSLVGALGYEAQSFPDLFHSSSFIGTIGPSMRWDVLNDGRLLNAIRVRDSLLETAVVDYQNAVLSAGREVEDGLVFLLRSESQARFLNDSAAEAKVAADEAVVLSKDVKFDLNRAFVTSNFLVGQQNKLAQARGNIALAFIQIYKALGGGWEIRLRICEPLTSDARQPLAGQARTQMRSNHAMTQSQSNGNRSSGAARSSFYRDYYRSASSGNPTIRSAPGASANASQSDLQAALHGKPIISSAPAAIASPSRPETQPATASSPPIKPESSASDVDWKPLIGP
jgi:hypothetical protein